MKISTFGNIKHKSPKKHRLTKKHISSKKVNKNHNKKHRSTKKVNKKHIKNHIKKHKKIYKGGVKETDGFIIQVDDFNMPVENGLDYENAEIFLTNFLFNDNFIKTYLEKDTESLLTFLKSPEINLYSGDEEQLDNLIEELISKNMNSFLKLYKIVDPKSYDEFIKSVYNQPTEKSIITTEKERELVSAVSGGIGPGGVAILVSPKSPELYKPEEQGLKKKVFTAVRGVMTFGVHAALGVGTSVINVIKQKIKQAPPMTSDLESISIPEAPMPAAPMPAAERIIDWSQRRHVCVFNVSGTLQPFITKISTEPQFIESYGYEYSLYEKLRRKPVIKPNELENFFNYQRKDAITVAGPIIINLDFSVPGGKQFIKPIDLRKYTAPNNIQMYTQYGRINWCAMNGTFNALHFDYSIIMDDTSIFDINRRQDKIVKGLNLIFNNLNYFYNVKGFVHCDFKLNNILVRVDPPRENILSAIMFDLDFSTIMPNFIEGKTNRSELDRLQLPLTPAKGGLLNNYLMAENVGIRSFSGGFCHFFDCYFSAISFFVTVLNNNVAKDSVVNLPWNYEPLHSINIFKTCYLLLKRFDKKLNKINSLDYGGYWGSIQLVNILPVILYTIPQDEFNTFSNEQKTVMKWIWKSLRDCDIRPNAVDLMSILNTVYYW